MRREPGCAVFLPLRHCGQVIHFGLNRLNRNGCRGVTLVELIVVLVLASVIFVIGAGLIVEAGRSFSTGRDITEVAWQGRVALERMERELRAISSTAGISTWTATALTFTDTSGTSIGYALGGSILQRTQAPTSAPQPQPLADSVTSLAFSYWDRAGVEVVPGVGAVTSIYYVTVTLSVTNSGFSSTFRTTVHPGNF